MKAFYGTMVFLDGIRYRRAPVLFLNGTSGLALSGNSCRFAA